MSEPLTVIEVDRFKGGVLVGFSDGTTTFFTAEELSILRPDRMPSGSKEAGQ